MSIADVPRCISDDALIAAARTVRTGPVGRRLAGYQLVTTRRPPSEGLLYLTSLLRSQQAWETCGEPVSLLQHALQCAYQAELHGASDAMVVAALLHDVGWLIRTTPDESEARHSEIAAAVLGQWLPEAVTEPVRLHVAAKRYLCTVDETYPLALSAASARRLEEQGGTLDARQMVRFVATKYAPQAVQLRRWDDQAKVVGAKVPGLEHYEMRLAMQLIG
jgi:predicted HD phosphohydrolase